MAIERWDPQRELVRLQETVNRIFEEALRRSTVPTGGDRTRVGDWRPPLDLFEEAEHFVLRVDLPGVAPGEVELRVEDTFLLLEGERRGDREVFLRMERPVGRFSARVALPPNVDRQEVHATQRNGVLEIVLPKKKQEEVPVSRVEIAVG